MSFDITIAFDEAEYLNPQLYMFVNTLKDNIQEDTVLHVVTNRQDDDPVLKYISKNIYNKIYKKDKSDFLKSRCRYMFNSFEMETDKEWVIKVEADMLFLKHLDELKKLMNQQYDILIGQECRRMIDNDAIEFRIWRNIYKALNVPMPTEKIKFIEDGKEGLPLYDTSLIMVKSKYLDYINKNWVPMTKVCEKWIQYNIHPNEFAFTALIHNSDMKCKLFNPSIYDFNPISHFRKGKFPSQELIDNPNVPDDVVIMQYHRPWWLKLICDSNPKIKKIVDNSVVDKKWLDSEVDTSQFVEKT